MAKYEKFEEWMIGKKISVGNYQGVVLGRHFPSIVPSAVVCIRYKIGDGPTEWRWVELECVTFLEEETSPIPWEVGQVVWDVAYGRGVVHHVFEKKNGNDGQVQVEFDSTKGYKEWYTLEGAYQLSKTPAQRTLFFSEPTIIADTMPPKKPFLPKLKEGDKVVVVSKDDSDNSSVGEVMRENEFQVTFTDGRLFKKEYWNIFKIGEEVKYK